MSFLNALNIGSSLLSLPFRIADTVRGHRMAEELNRLAGQGRETLRPLGDEMRGAGLETAERLRSMTGAVQARGAERGYGNVGQFASQFFGVPQAGGTANMRDVAPYTLASDSGKGSSGVRGRQNEAEQWASARRDSTMGTLGKVQVGQGGLSGLVKEAGQEWLDKLYARETARNDEYSEGLDTTASNLRADFESLKGLLGTEYHDLIDRTEATITSMEKRADAALEEARLHRTEALDEIVNDTAMQVATESASLAGDLAQAEAQLAQSYAGADMSNPATASKYAREKAALQSQYKNQMLLTTRTTQGQFSKFKADVALTAGNMIANLHASGLATIAGAAGTAASAQASAYGAYSSAMENAMTGLGRNLTTIEGLRLDSQKLMSTLFAGAEGQVFATQANAYQYDADKLAALYNAVSTLDNQVSSEAVYRETTYANMANAAWANWGTMQTAYAQSLINAQMEMVSWADPFAAMFADTASLRQLQLQERQLDLMERGQNMGLIGDVAGAAGSAAGGYFSRG